MKSLFIISVPRSASTALEKACAKGLSLEKCGEILNRGHYPVKAPQYAKEKHFEHLKKRCSKYSESRVIRDVIQPHFIVQNIDWLMERFNMIFLLRPVAEIMVSRKRLKWKMPRKTVLRYQNMLCGIPDQEFYRHLDYYDFIQDNPNKLVEILQSWYPECPPFNYIDARFRSKRHRTSLDIKTARIKPRKKS